jgi:hypothetical protein
LLIAPAFAVEQAAGQNELALVYRIKVSEAAVHGDHADMAIEADGMPLSHARPQLLRPATLRFPDAIDVHLTAASELPLFPATVPVNQRTGRDITVTVRNNAPEIRNFHLEIKAEGLEFLPATMDVAVGASVARDVSFRAFAKDASPGLHAGTVTLSGAAAAREPVQFAVIPQNGAAAFSVNGFSLIESVKGTLAGIGRQREQSEPAGQRRNTIHAGAHYLRQRRADFCGGTADHPAGGPGTAGSEAVISLYRTSSDQFSRIDFTLPVN